MISIPSGPRHSPHRSESGVDNPGEAYPGNKEKQTADDGDDAGIAQHPQQADPPLRKKQEIKMSPHQNNLHRHVGAGVDQPLLPEHRGDNGNDQISRIGVDHQRLLQRAEAQRSFQQIRPTDQKDMRRDRPTQRQQKPRTHLGGVLHLEGPEHNAWYRQVKADNRESPALLRRKQ